MRCGGQQVPSCAGTNARTQRAVTSLLAGPPPVSECQGLSLLLDCAAHNTGYTERRRGEERGEFIDEGKEEEREVK